MMTRFLSKKHIPKNKSEMAGYEVVATTS